MTKKAVILLSGGLDSATCMGVAKAQGYQCYGLSFAYGQRHSSELAAAKRVAVYFDAVDHKIITLDLAAFGGSALTDESIDVPDFADDGNIPVTYVPARNTIFLSMALAYAEVVGASDIILGASSVDYSGYPDCRPEFFDAFRQLANLATKVGVTGENLINLQTPLIYLSKAETVSVGLANNVDYSLTVSCYQADDEGRACGRCDSCMLRKKGFAEAGVADPTCYINESM